VDPLISVDFVKTKMIDKEVKSVDFVKIRRRKGEHY